MSADNVNHPAHYTSGREYEPIKVIVDQYRLPHCVASAVSYLARAGRKGDLLEDLRKARFYVDYAIKSDEVVPEYSGEWGTEMIVSDWGLTGNLSRAVRYLLLGILPEARSSLLREIGAIEQAQAEWAAAHVKGIVV